MKNITKIPMQELWNEKGDVDSVKLKNLNKKKLIKILKSEKVRFVVANIGFPPNWVPVEECYEFWKAEVKDHCVENGAEIVLENYPDEYVYVASQWKDENKIPIILLEKHH